MRDRSPADDAGPEPDPRAVGRSTPRVAPGVPQYSLEEPQYSTGERASGIGWLCFWAALSAAVEIYALASRLTLPGGATIAVPWPIGAAFIFTLALTRTALLWIPRRAVAVLPTMLWVGVVFVLFAAEFVPVNEVPLGGAGVALFLSAGVVGGGWPLVRGR